VTTTKPTPLKLIAFRASSEEISKLKDLGKSKGVKPLTLMRELFSDALAKAA
jgi:hypothetical protein